MTKAHKRILLRFGNDFNYDHFRVGRGNLDRRGRTAADINQGKPLEEVTIIERLGRTKLEYDSHAYYRATDMPRGRRLIPRIE